MTLGKIRKIKVRFRRSGRKFAFNIFNVESLSETDKIAAVDKRGHFYF